MDFESLTPEQMQMTLRMCDILSMEDFSVGAALLASFDWNLEVTKT